MSSQKPSNFETLGQWNDYWGHVLGSAPANFTAYDLARGDIVKVEDQAVALSEAFDELRSGFRFAERKVKDPHLLRVIRELIEMSYEAYVSDESKLGAHILQEARGMIWPGSKMPVKYAVEAERRAFGEVSRFAGVRVSPYPYEGSIDDLGPGQASLLEMAKQYCSELFQNQREFKQLGWVLRHDSTVASLSASSRKKLIEVLAEQAKRRDTKAVAMAELVISAVSGLIVFHLHEGGYARVEVIGKTSNWAFEDLRFHLHEATIFTGL